MARPFHRPQPSLTVFFLHALFDNKAEVENGQIFPHEGLTVDQFREFVEFFQEAGYDFVSPDQVIDGLNPERKQLMISFDDGYANNARALPVLQACKVPAVFCIASNFVEQNRSFWWDAHYRERNVQGWAFRNILHEQNQWKSLGHEAVEEKVKMLFGEKVLEPVSDLDRPFSPQELRDFARHEEVYIGNHTHHHAILTNYSDDEIRSEIQRAQSALAEMTGQTPVSIAYPNGNSNERVARLAREAGLKIGLTGQRVRHFHSDPYSLLDLGRVPLYGTWPIRRQCEQWQSDLSLKWKA